VRRFGNARLTPLVRRHVNTKLIYLSFALASLVSFAQQPLTNLKGSYTSNEDFGILVFRQDGVFGYKIPSKHLFYSEDNLPPNQGHYRIVDSKRVEFIDPPQSKVPFTIEIQEQGQTLLLVRLDGAKPTKAIYRLQ
jgi:hypothetical protein